MASNAKIAFKRGMNCHDSNAKSAFMRGYNVKSGRTKIADWQHVGA